MLRHTAERELTWMPGSDLPGSEGKKGEKLQAEQALERIWRAHHTSLIISNSYKISFFICFPVMLMRSMSVEG